MKASTARQRAPRREPDLDAVLEAAVESLLANGERGFRIEHIIEKTGISRSSLYLHFTDRDGLVEAASMEIFFREVVGNVDRTVEAMNTVHTKEQARAIVRPLIEAIAAQPESTRWNRVMVLSASRFRDKLYQRLESTQTEINDKFTTAFERWKGLGILRPEVDTREAAAFIQVNTFGRVVRDLDRSMADLHPWTDLMVHMHLALLAE